MTLVQIKKIAKKLKRPKKSHKGNFGRVFILAGSKGMAGAAGLCGLSALRAGAGLVSVGVPESIYRIVAQKDFEVMVIPLPETKKGVLAYRAYCPVLKLLKNQDVVALGPGLSQERTTQKFIRRIVRSYENPIVLDADGLNAFVGFCDILKERKSETVLTPHVGEFARFFKSKFKNQDLNTNDALRKELALECSKKFKSILVLKGAKTVVASPEGNVYVNRTGNPGMATAGSGDVLTGIITAFIGQKLPVFEAACLGVYLHGKAGDVVAKKIGSTSLIAGDIIRFLPETIKEFVK